MTVHFIGAGPGAADLITLRGRDLIMRSPVCLYAGSLVPKALLDYCPQGARIINTAPLSLEDIAREFKQAHEEQKDVARLHSGDLSLWSAMGEQIELLRALNIDFTITPGVPSFAAAAAALGVELTRPEAAQSIVLTRTSGRASSMPPTETIRAFAATGSVLAVHLSIHTLASVIEDARPYYGDTCPVAVVYRATWPDEVIIRGTITTIIEQVSEHDIERTALILIGPTLGSGHFKTSALYDADYQRRYRTPGWRGSDE